MTMNYYVSGGSELNERWTPRQGGGYHGACGSDGSDGWGGQHCVVELTSRATVFSCETFSELSHTTRGVTEGDARDHRETAIRVRS